MIPKDHRVPMKDDSQHESTRGNGDAGRTPHRPFSFREEANAVVCSAFRNGFIEELHAGEWSDLLAKADVRRVTDEEMDRMMSEGAAQIVKLLRMKEQESERYWQFVAFYNQPSGYVAHWDKEEPSLLPLPPASEEVQPPATPQDEARCIARYTFGQSHIVELLQGEDTTLIGSKGLSRITDVEVALIMIGTSARMAELLWLKAHDLPRYDHLLSLFRPTRIQ